METITLRFATGGRNALTAADVVSLIRQISAGGGDPFFAFRACLDRADEDNPSFEAITFHEGSLIWDESTQTGGMTVAAEWKAIHGCADWSCTGRQSTRVELRFDAERRELVLIATVTPPLPSTHEEF